MNRRDIAKALAGAATLVALPSCKQRAVPPSVPAAFSASHFQSRLEALRLAYEAKQEHVSATLQPGIAEADVRRRCAWFPSRLPDEIVALYGWRDGQPLSPGYEDHPFLFRDCGFTALANVEKEYRMLMASYGTDPRRHELLKHSFPFAAFDAGWLVLTCRERFPGSPGERSVVSVFQGVMPMFHSMDSMVETCIEWVDNTGVLAGLPFIGKHLEDEILERFNPGILEMQRRGDW
jgi:hypothetical protein